MKETSYLDEVILKEILTYACNLESENINAMDLVEEIKKQIILAMKNK